MFGRHFRWNVSRAALKHTSALFGSVLLTGLLLSGDSALAASDRALASLEEPSRLNMVSGVAQAACPYDVVFLGSRGSGQAFSEGDGLGSQVNYLRLALQVELEQRGFSLTHVANPYPAPSVSWAFIGAPLLNPDEGYWNAVDEGASWLADTTVSLLQDPCGYDVILAGYSQGADVTRLGLWRLQNRLSVEQWSRIRAVGLIADPHFDPDESTFEKLGNHSSWEDGSLVGLPLNAYTMFQLPLWVNDRTVEACRAHDPVCQDLLSLHLPTAILIHSDYIASPPSVCWPDDDSCESSSLIDDMVEYIAYLYSKAHVDPQVSVVPAVIDVGGTVSIHGSGLMPADSPGWLSLLFTRLEIRAPSGALWTSWLFPDDLGVADKTAPWWNPVEVGIYTVTVKDPHTGKQATTTFSIGSGTGPPPSLSPQVTVDPLVAYPGDQLHQPGWGFTSNSTVHLHFLDPDGAEDLPSIVKYTNQYGVYDLWYTIPMDKEIGVWTYYATDDATGVSSPPVTYEVLSPGAGRQCPAGYVEWGAGSGSWNTAANWETGLVPDVDDDVCFDQVGITVTGGGGSVNDLLVVGHVTLLGADITVDGAFVNEGVVVQGYATNDPADVRLLDGAVFVNTGVHELGHCADVLTSSGLSSYVNNGTLRKSGTCSSSVSPSSIAGDVEFSGAGTVEVTAGTLYIQDAPEVVSGGVLLGGIWKASDGGDLVLTGATITAIGSEASVALSGAGSTFVQLANLATMSGDLTLTDGAAFSAKAGLTNAGNLVIGPGSTLTVPGGYTQSSGSGLSFGLDGPVASGRFGRVLVTGLVTLDGDAGFFLEDGFVPGTAEVYDVLIWGSRVGWFSQVSGVPGGFAVTALSDRLRLESAPGLCRGLPPTLVGSGGADTLTGTFGPDVILGLGGNDTINGLGGDDLICGGDGADLIHGGDGKDKIYGDKGADTIYGDEMSDRIYGGDGNDLLRGNGGTRDRLYGGGGTDDLNGGSGDDDRCTLGETYSACEVIF